MRTVVETGERSWVTLDWAKPRQGPSEGSYGEGDPDGGGASENGVGTERGSILIGVTFA